MSWETQDADHIYQISRWSDGYFQVNDQGDLCATPHCEKPGPSISLPDIINEIKNNNISLPAVIRFHDILRAQVHKLNQTFNETIKEAEYQGSYFGVYPIKVNQMREVVEEITDAGSEYNYGLEAGSKGELLAALAHNNNPKALTILNGYKDEEYLRLAMLGTILNRKVIIVIEKLNELDLVLKIAKEMNTLPMIGIRAKLSSKGSGKWASSGGDMAKFGLTAPEIIKVIEKLKEENKIEMLKLFHFHIGSQIPDIRTIKEALTEGARFYTELVKLGAPLEYFDVGGGAGLNYDGSKSKGNSSTNYDLSEYIADVVYILKKAFNAAQIKHPHIVSESGRIVTAHHSCVITNIFGKIDIQKADAKPEVQHTDHDLVKNMMELTELLHAENYQDSYNDAVVLKEEATAAFKLGVITLRERANLETLYWALIQRIVRLAKDDEFAPKEILNLENNFASQYLCNLSVFQSTPDIWAISQVLPIVPIHRLNEEPSVTCTLADITCDSDGKVSQFLSPEGLSSTIKLHPLKDDHPYHIGFFMTGAYQDVMGDMHNLFGRLNEVHVYADDEDPTDFYLEEIIYGNSTSDVLNLMQYSPSNLANQIKMAIDKQIRQGLIRPKQRFKLIEFYESALKSYTYLQP